MGGRSFSDAKRIRRAERDRELALDDLLWPQAHRCPSGWEERNGYIARTIKAKLNVMPVGLDETILRFPSAPLHSLHRIQEHHVDLKEADNFHTYRVLRCEHPDARDRPVTRIFLMHTGLNERDSMGVYYRLASNLIERDALTGGSTVCIVTPFPGHLTRFPFSGFAETPLDRYLWDGSHLFRQFVRHMIETQWFLSVLARRSSYRYASGANLLAESDDIQDSRLHTPVLAAKMHEAWLKLHKQSEEATVAALAEQPRALQVKDPPGIELFESAIDSVRDLLNLNRDYPGRTGEPDPFDEPQPNGSGKDQRTGGEQSESESIADSKESPDGGERNDAPVDPPLHVIGYSLGGFTAQSVFMSWPFLVSSCCTLLGAGALRELAPSTFAHPEEWQTVLHSLRYELDDRMMGDEIGVELDSIAGIDIELFTFFKRTFYEVFQQDYRGSIQTRLAAFRKRMLFVVGGKDPIVRPESVINSSPPGGINLLEVGGLSHFLDGSPEDQEESQQRLFWVPEMVGLLSDFADGVTNDHERERRFTMFDCEMEKPAASQQTFEAKLLGVQNPGGSPDARMRRLAANELLSIGSDGALPGANFERCLDDLLVRAASVSPTDDGVLFVLRNEMPTMLLHDSLIRERAAALYHDDFGIVRYCYGVKTRREMVEENIERICLVLPWNAGQIVKNMDLRRAYPSQSETAGGQVLRRVSNEEAWEASLTECKQLVRGAGSQSIRSFDGSPILRADDDKLPKALRDIAKEFVGREELIRVPSLPDCWVWVSRKVLNVPGHHALAIDSAIEKFGQVIPPLCEGKDRSWEPGLLEELRTGQIRIVTVSRARYNPRFRGRLIVDPKSARSLLVHVALCLALSQPTANKNLSTVFA